MSKGTEGHFDTLPIGRLGLIPLNSSAALGKKVDDYLVSWRKGRGNEFAEKYVAAYEGYERDSYIIQSQVPRFGSGEAKGIINESVRGDDIYILLDVCNYSLTYSLCGYTNHMSPDDHFQDLKRVIAACNGKARRINVIMPFLYEGRQHRRIWKRVSRLRTWSAGADCYGRRKHHHLRRSRPACPERDSAAWI